MQQQRAKEEMGQTLFSAQALQMEVEVEDMLLEHQMELEDLVVLVVEQAEDLVQQEDLLEDLLLKEVLVGQLDMGLRVDKVQTLEVVLVVEEQVLLELTKQELGLELMVELEDQTIYLDHLVHIALEVVVDLGGRLGLLLEELLVIQAVGMVEMVQQTMLMQLEFHLAEEEVYLLHQIEVVEVEEVVEIMLEEEMDEAVTEVAELWLSVI